MNRWRLVVVCAMFMILGLQQAFAQSKAKGSKRQSPSPYEVIREPLKLQAKDFAPKRREPVFTGAFSVGLVLVRFPDTRSIDLSDVRQRFNFTGELKLADYFKDYSQGITWPALLVVGAESFPQSVYVAPEPLGYYCEHDTWDNPLGYTEVAVGHERVAKLKQDARAHAFRSYKPAPGLPTRSDGTPQVLAFVYERNLIQREEFKALIRPRYPKGMMNRDREAWEGYSPKINWSDPLWPNSSVQILNEGDSGTLCHELGHVLGAPDYYHATEPHDGIPGTPCLPWSYGPTGPGYCRAIHQAFLPASAYPMLTKEGAYTLQPRRTNPAGDKTLGAFIPSAHPNYLFCVEYVKGEKSPLGNSDASGLLIQVINVTLASDLLGAPDMCYAYRTGDRWLRGEGAVGDALFGEHHNRPAFDLKSDPPARLPNLLDSGIALENIRESSDASLSFTLRRTTPPLSPSAVRESLLPKINLDEVTAVLPNSFYAKATVTFRGEPLKSEYGFCWDTLQRPTCKVGKVFPLYHRDRYTGRILGLSPNTTYYVRAYVRSALGVSYSEQELRVKTLAAKPLPESVPSLLEDRFSGNWSIERFHCFRKNESHVVGSCALVGLLKLMAYYRAPLDADVRSPEFNYARMHTNPSLTRPKFRMPEFDRGMNTARDLADKAKLTENTFTKDFDRHLKKVFGLRPRPECDCIETLSATSIPKLEPLIRSQLAASKPVMVLQESEQPMTPTEYALMSVLIDGFNETGEFHLIFPMGKDRSFDRESGWYPLSVLLEKTNLVKVVFGLDAPSQR